MDQVRSALVTEQPSCGRGHQQEVLPCPLPPPHMSHLQMFWHQRPRTVCTMTGTRRHDAERRWPEAASCDPCLGADWPLVSEVELQADHARRAATKNNNEEEEHHQETGGECRRSKVVVKFLLLHQDFNMTADRRQKTEDIPG